MKKILNLCLILLFLNTISLGFGNDFNKPKWFPEQDSLKINYCQSQPLVKNDNEIIIIFTGNSFVQDTIYISRSTDGSSTWSSPLYVNTINRQKEDKVFLSGIITGTGRIIIVYTIGENPTNNPTKFIFSDDDGSSWSVPQNIIGQVNIANPKITSTEDGKLWILGWHTRLFYSTNNGSNWAAHSTIFSLPPRSVFDMTAVSDSNYLLVFDVFDNNTGTYKLYSKHSTDGGTSWSDNSLITSDLYSEQRPRLFKENNGTLWLITQSREETSFPNIYQYEIKYRKSTDNGVSWSEAVDFTKYLGFDGEHNVYGYNDKPLISFLSNRWYGKNQIWLGQIGVINDEDNPPVLFKFENAVAVPDVMISIRAYVGSPIGILNTQLFYSFNEIVYGPLQMYDDGNHNDNLAGDNIWGVSIGPFCHYDYVKYWFKVTDSNSVSINFDGGNLLLPSVPVENKWLSAGSLHNWYSSMGAEYEHGFIPNQQYGLRWPGIYDLQDMQCSKGFWVGATNFTDEHGRNFPYKVVHVGPRVTGEYVFYPIEFKLMGKFANPIVTVNGNNASGILLDVDEIDGNLVSDRLILNRVNTQLGVTVQRNIYQFSQEYHNNYIVSEYTFTNTGNTDYDSQIELPDNTLSGLYFYYLYRWAINRNTRYAIGNSTGWGINTMLDTRGDGVMNDPPNENFRAQYGWHGNFPPFTAYDNIGGPLWRSTINVSPEDTIGRLGAPQFIGVVTLHADKSAANNIDDFNQPSTTSWEGSDEPNTLQNDPFNDQKMISEYAWMSRGHKPQRHAYTVEPDGNFAHNDGDPALGTPGGFSAANGYGPYTIGQNESITLVWAEAVDGIDRATAIEVGRQYKWGQITAEQKNVVVLTGKDSLFNTFKKAIANYNNGNGFIIPQPPNPPNRFEVVSGEDKIYLLWKHTGQGSMVKLFEIYRASGGYDSVHTLIHTALPTDSSFIDTLISRGREYFYYIQAVGDPADNNGAAMTPLGALKSGRYYTQTYEGASSTLTGINEGNYSIDNYMLYQNYPNPFNPVTTIEYYIKEYGLVNLKIYNLLGEEVAQLVNEVKEPGNYKVIFNASGLSSGIYFYRIQVNNFRDTKKFLLLK